VTTRSSAANALHKTAGTIEGTTSAWILYMTSFVRDEAQTHSPRANFHKVARLAQENLARAAKKV
jgi:hypothetical protein